MQVTARVPGKLVLIGEYAVLHGSAALVTAVDRYAVVSAAPLPADSPGQVVIEAPDVGAARAHGVWQADRTVALAPRADGAEARLSLVAAALGAAAQRGAAPDDAASPSPLRLGLDTGGFLHPTAGKLGLGSSAAVTVGVLAAASAYFKLGQAARSGRPRPPTKTLSPTGLELVRWALAVHRQAQGHGGSGIDVAASALGGVLRYRIGAAAAPEAQPCPWPRGLHMVAVWSGAPASTSSLVGAVRALAAAQPAAHQGLIARLSAAAEGGVAAFEGADIDGFFDAVADFCQGLEALSAASGAPIVTDAHRHIGRLVRAMGGVYKPSGAGGGDLGIGFFRAESDSLAAMKRLAGAGYETVPLGVSGCGLALLLDEVA